MIAAAWPLAAAAVTKWTASVVFPGPAFLADDRNDFHGTSPNHGLKI